ncbi:MAG: exodeoxyribonuclease VII small subunit [Planctomycetota bacterium]
MAKKKATKKKPSAEEGRTFEELLAELESAVGSLEGGELGLDEALAAYERGVKRLRRCHAQLEAAEQKIAVLSGVDADGNPVTESLPGAGGADLDNPTASRAAKRTRQSAASRSNGVDDSTPLF